MFFMTFCSIDISLQKKKKEGGGSSIMDGEKIRKQKYEMTRDGNENRKVRDRENNNKKY